MEKIDVDKLVGAEGELSVRACLFGLTAFFILYIISLF